MRNVIGSAATDQSGQFPSGTKILIVDDVLSIRVVLEFFLKIKGADVLVADNASDAIAAALRDEPDLVLMDMHLPDVDGYIATRKLKQSGFPGAIIAMTGRVQKGERERCLLAGCADFLTKPIDLRRLREAIDRHLPADSMISAS